MIKLNIQINLIFFSLIYGLIFSLFLDLNYKLLHHKNIIIKYISTIFCTIISVITYFYGIQKICYGILHIYSLILIIIGFIIHNLVLKLIEKKKNK